jgi:hypothetical protein
MVLDADSRQKAPFFRYFTSPGLLETILQVGDFGEPIQYYQRI